MALHSASHRVLNLVPPHADNAQGHFIMTDAADRSRGCECVEDSCSTLGWCWCRIGGLGGSERAEWVGAGRGRIERDG